MNKTSKLINYETIQANIDVHAALANAGEYNKSPHFRAENQKKVKGILEELFSKTIDPNEIKLLDMGCGTGFILHLVADIVSEAHGIDVTEDMMSQVDTSLENVYLKTAYAEETGFPENSFDIVTAYSFLDHLHDYKVVIQEAYRVLKSGGIFYSDLNPNAEFSECMMKVENSTMDNDALPIEISREIKGMLHNGEYYSENFGIEEETLTKAEPQKSFNRGFYVEDVVETAKKLGFTDVKIEYDWFLGQGVLMNTDSVINIDDINTYLHRVLPASSCFFKYLRFIFIK